MLLNLVRSDDTTAVYTHGRTGTKFSTRVYTPPARVNVRIMNVSNAAARCTDTVYSVNRK